MFVYNILSLAVCQQKFFIQPKIFLWAVSQAKMVSAALEFYVETIRGEDEGSRQKSVEGVPIRVKVGQDDPPRSCLLHDPLQGSKIEVASDLPLRERTFTYHKICPGSERNKLFGEAGVPGEDCTFPFCYPQGNALRAMVTLGRLNRNIAESPLAGWQRFEDKIVSHW